ncbi:alkylhydroperoxidase domain protein [Schumannella luteola]|uniref:Alkylhydroperoxidase domain protein n=1 Tax=Schumannella luteola TaxID=472059 RepID=A0A852YFJ1_9MICO|nr:alkylhydroperoxidase domain protein [Schumannella luteola]NYG98527.1 alkylhydroperoxidase domain protein [Schumannella luteola]TPX01252.1 alkylhydroperoxidase domain protein [Schumannella luteola]
MSESVLRPENTEPVEFTQENLGWVPWLEPFPIDELTERHWHGLTDKGRANSDYFRLLVRDPDILGARTRTDNDIFYNEKGGLPRALRELSATTASRVNGCIFCASVHSRFATQKSKRGDEVQALLDGGVDAEQPDAAWRAVIDASAALTRTPSDFGPQHVQALRDAGFDDLAIADVIHGAAFFNWANRLMLSLGEPTPPAS